ncbi:MAG: sulfatase [Planctomyces sp.]|nr:sulfatase [Planctomyces sp.]
MQNYSEPITPNSISRREWLWQSGGGLGGIALASLLSDQFSDQALGATAAAASGGVVQPLHVPAKAKRVVQLFMSGAASHIDTFDYKPALIEQHGQKWDPGEKVELFQNGLGNTLKSPWSWKPHGESGKHLSEIVAPLGNCVDDIAFVHNMVAKTGVHSQSTLLQATGFQEPGFPGVGAWVSYGLGSMNKNLPTFVVLPDHRGFASNGAKNWSSAFLPAHHQGTVLRPGTENPINDLFPADNDFISNRSERDTQKLLEQLNERHQAERPGDSRLEARIKSYELAARMQLAAPEALDLSGEPEHILKLYGLDHGMSSFPKEINPVEETEYFGRKCLVARRLLERGVRFVQIWSGNDNRFPRRNWDSHEDIARDHGPLAIGMSMGAAALIQDLKQRGMLDDTLILWTTEFGRMPCSQGSTGRDHNPFCFTNWLCGGGIKGGVTHGPSDEWGFKPQDREHPTTCYDIHATLLHLLGIDHTRLTFRSNGIDRRLTDVHGHVIDELLA